LVDLVELMDKNRQSKEELQYKNVARDCTVDGNKQNNKTSKTI